MRRLRALLPVVVVSCASRLPATPTPMSTSESSASLGRAPNAEVDGSADAGDGTNGVAEDAPLTRIQAMRIERWAEAARLIDAEPEMIRAQPAMRFARARAALGAGDGKTAKHCSKGSSEYSRRSPRTSGRLVRRRRCSRALSPKRPGTFFARRAHRTLCARPRFPPKPAWPLRLEGLWSKLFAPRRAPEMLMKRLLHASGAWS